MAEQKNRHAFALGRKGGLARSKALSPADKKLAAQRAAQARWKGKQRGGPGGPSGPSKSALYDQLEF